MEDKIIIGLTGSFGSGCTSVAKILRESGFHFISISSLLKKEVERQHINLSELPKKEIRKILQDIGNKKRERNLGILIQEALSPADFSKDIVIESIKNPGEIRELKKHPHSYIVALDTDFETRAERILDDEYDGDRKQFVIDNQREKDEGISSGQKLQECVDLADIVINNDKRINTPKEVNEFNEKVTGYVELMRKPGVKRCPTDMELWMNNAYSISLQSTCLKRKVGAILVKEGYQIATGKNDVPLGERSCKIEYNKQCYRDGLRKTIKYCPVCSKDLDEEFRCKDNDCKYNKNDLIKLIDKCRALHAEENAILQTARLGGVSLRNSTIYTTTYPCKLCANKIISVGIKEIVYVEAYPDSDAVDFFERHKKDVKVTKFEGVKASAFHTLFREQQY